MHVVLGCYVVAVKDEHWLMSQGVPGEQEVGYMRTRTLCHIRKKFMCLVFVSPSMSILLENMSISVRGRGNDSRWQGGRQGRQLVGSWAGRKHMWCTQVRPPQALSLFIYFQIMALILNYIV